MGPHYEVAPIGRRGRSRSVLVAVALVLVVLVALAKPWGEPQPAAPPAAAAPSPPPTIAQALPDVAAPWPAQPSPGLDATDPVSTAVAVRLLAAHGGTWGVGDGGSGPRLIRDAVWIDWAAVAPGPPASVPDRLSSALGSASCAGLPTLVDRPSVMAVTASADIGAGWRVTAWWSDGTTAMPISGSIRQVVEPNERAAAYLERLDLAPWPDGRYELHVTTGHRTYALSVCVGAAR